MSKNPNIVLIMTDDQGPWALGCAGHPGAPPSGARPDGNGGHAVRKLLLYLARLLGRAGFYPNRSYTFKPRRARLAARRRHEGATRNTNE